MSEKNNQQTNVSSAASKSIIAGLNSEINEIRQRMDDVPSTVGMLTVKTANQTIREAANRPDPVALWLTLWYEGEVCCLFADSNLGKSIYAVQIASKIAETRRVLYFDFELSDKQFQLRYTDLATRQLHSFPANLYRVSIDPSRMNVSDYENRLIMEIECAAIKTDSRILIIDNLSYLCITSEKGEDAGQLMMRLMELKHLHNLSILVLAHTPKRPLYAPITQNDLAGSKKLTNFFDSMFAIGKSAKDENLRYIKQIKVRYGTNEYGADNVIVCTIEKIGDMLQFVERERCSEAKHLREITTEEREKMKAEAKQLYSVYRSFRAVANKMGISKSTAERYVKF